MQKETGGEHNKSLGNANKGPQRSHAISCADSSSKQLVSGESRLETSAIALAGESSMQVEAIEGESNEQLKKELRRSCLGAPESPEPPQLARARPGCSAPLQSTSAEQAVPEQFGRQFTNSCGRILASGKRVAESSLSTDLNCNPIKLSVCANRTRNLSGDEIGNGGASSSSSGSRIKPTEVVPLNSASDPASTACEQPAELEVEWLANRVNLFRRARTQLNNQTSSSSRSSLIRTSLVGGQKRGGADSKRRLSLRGRGDAISRTIKSFVGRSFHIRQLTTSNHHNQILTHQQQSPNRPIGEIHSKSFVGTDEFHWQGVGKNAESNNLNASVSHQSILRDDYSLADISAERGLSSNEFERIEAVAATATAAAVESAVVSETGASAIAFASKLSRRTARTQAKTEGSSSVINMESGSCLAKNKHIIEDNNKTKKLHQQQQKSTSQPRTSQHVNLPQGNRNLEKRRSTQCSSNTAATSNELNSSLSSVNNFASESNNNCSASMKHHHHQLSRDEGERSDDEDYDERIASNVAGALISAKDAARLKAGINQFGRPKNEPSDCGQSIEMRDEDEANHPKREKKNDGLKKRDNWDKNIEFLLAVIGFAVDLGNVWRFPYICYKNGGGAFLIPYTIMFILGGLPIFYLEMSLGQYFSSGCLTVWKRVCPMAKGIGYAMCVLNFFTGLYYNTIISWAVFFFVQSFTSVLPWTSCDNPWNSLDCKTIDQRQALKSNFTAERISIGSNDSNQTLQQTYYSSPTKDYFEREVLRVHLSSGIDDLGSIRAPLAIYLAIVFICIYFAIWKGVKSTGKAVWITALLPYFVLIPLLIRGVFLEGAWLGIRYYLYPQWVKIIDVDVWVEAAKQIYFSLGPGFGTLMALSSYNKFNHNCHRDALIAASVNYFASFISGLVIFAVLGYMATIENVSVSDVATEGPGLVFQVYPEGLATMQFSSMWSVLFFIMVITLGIDSTFGGLESVITGLCDEYPRVLRAHRGIFIALLIVLIYLCSLPTTTYGGNYVIYVLESYGTSLSLLFIVLIETIIVCWLYGADKFCKNLEEMYGETPGAYWRICWKYISPTILLIIFFAACGQELDKYHTLTNGGYVYPGWAPTVGLLMTGSSVCCIPVYAIYYIKTKTSGSFLERLKIACKPIEGEQRGGSEKEIYVDALTDKIRDENDHLDTVI